MTPEKALIRVLSSLELPRAMGFSKTNTVVVDLTALDILVRDYEDLKFRMESLEK